MFRPAVNSLGCAIRCTLNRHSVRSLRTSGVHAEAVTNSKQLRIHHSIPESRAQVEVSTAEWSFVERLIPPKRVPKPNLKPGEIAPSGWIAPSAKVGDYPYYIKRNANHMVPVYVKANPILSRHITLVKNIEGDVFAFGEELLTHLREILHPRRVNLRVHEPHQMIQIKGAFLGEVKEFLLKKGF